MASNENTDNKDKPYISDSKELLKEERLYIFEGDESAAVNKKSLIGLAISGGGIRSASFGLGVMQALVQRGVLEKVDYLSTVSGGGYIGSSLTWFLNQGLPDGKPTGTNESNFPFGGKGEGGRLGRDRNLILDFIRQHGNYLNPGYGINLTSLIAVLLRSMFVSLFVYLTMITIVMIALKVSDVFTSLNLISILDIKILNSYNLNILLWTAISLLVIQSICNLVFSIWTAISGVLGWKRYKGLIASQRAIGWGWSLIIGFFLTGSIPYLHQCIGNIWGELITGGGFTLIGAITGFMQMRKEQSLEKPKGGTFSKFRIVIGAFALIYGLLLIGYTFAGIFVGLTGDEWWIWLIVLVLVAAIFGTITNLNYIGLHRMYRDRLMETFQPDKKNIIENQWGRAIEADHALLEDMCTGDHKRPYHLINANIVLVDSPTSKYRGRGGDSFILSPLYCGSDATGWRKTKTYMKSMASRGVTLPTAMAVSGAAVNPNTGVGGKGVTRNKLVSTLMSFLNLRLGYWASNPKLSKIWPFPPNFIFPGIRQGILGSGLTENKRIIELSDGGHFENLALYELIRRKVKVIIVSDGGADPNYKFEDLANAVVRVRVDFGAKIKFRDDTDANLEGILPGSAGKGILVKKYNLAKRGFAIADIEYAKGLDAPQGEQPIKGVMIYIKTTLVPDLPEDIYGYKSAHPTFPDQSTTDQFFDEGQFEAYRELGYQLTKKMLRDNAAAGWSWIPNVEQIN